MINKPIVFSTDDKEVVSVNEQWAKREKWILDELEKAYDEWTCIGYIRVINNLIKEIKK